MKYGRLFYDGELGRINVVFEDKSYGDGFHCGDILEAYNPKNRSWELRRLEYDHNRDKWFFVGFGSIPVSTEIRM